MDEIYQHMKCRYPSRYGPGTHINYLGTEQDSPDPLEHIVLDEVERMVGKTDTDPNTSIFTFNKEDHTLGNLISRLHQYRAFVFSAYHVPQPMTAKFYLGVTTNGSATPRGVVVKY